MHGKKKLLEAKYFLSKMIETKNNVDIFIYNLSAFLASSRSVLQYALKEAEMKPGGKKWYFDSVLNNSILGFFKDKRDLNIHEEPIEPHVIHKAMITETIHLSDSISIVIKDKDGNIKGEYTSPEEPKLTSEEEKSSAVSETEYKFSDWGGNEDVLTLTKLYLGQLENLVEDGIKKGFISG